MTPQQTGLSRSPWRTGSGGNSAAVPAVWRKSSYSASNGGQCVEVARNLPAIVAVRDSMDPHGARLMLPPAAWGAFVDRIKRGARNERLPPPVAEVVRIVLDRGTVVKLTGGVLRRPHARVLVHERPDAPVVGHPVAVQARVIEHRP